MKVSAFLFATFLTFTPAMISTANADDSGCKSGHTSVGTAFDVAQQYTDGGPFSGVTSGTTGTAIDVARDSMCLLGSLERIASVWPVNIRDAFGMYVRAPR